MTIGPDDPTIATPGARAPSPGAAPPFERVAHYRILRTLGGGGMGTVYEAFDEKLQRRVALKVLSNRMMGSERAGQRFDQEAWIEGRLDHPNLVKVYDRGVWNGLPWFSMEIADGGSLHEVIRNLKARGRDDRFSLVHGSRAYVEWAVGRVIAAARALDHAHRSGVVHRDVKPLNLLLSQDGATVKVVDFGLAMDVDAPRMTATGDVIGTVLYMAPELIRGRREAVGPATDIYALGVTLFELLTLELPHPADSPEQYMHAVLTSAARRASLLNKRVSRDLETVILKALEKEPAHRYRSAAAFADDLENVLALRPILASRPAWPVRTARWARRKPIHAALTLVLAIGLPLTAVLGARVVESRRVARRSQVESALVELRWLTTQPSRLRETVARASNVLEIDPGNEAALRARLLAAASVAQEPGDPREKDAMARRAIEDAESLVARHPDTSWPHRLHAYALRAARRATDADAADARARTLTAAAPTEDDLFVEADLASRRGDHAQAVDLFTRFLERFPNRPLALYWRARSYAELGRGEEALVDYRVASALDPSDRFVAMSLGRLLTRFGSYDEAERQLKRALALRPEEPRVLEALADNDLERGRHAISLGDAASARAAFERAEGFSRDALGNDRHAPWALVDLGASLMERNRLSASSDPALVAESVASYEEALKVLEDPEHDGDAGARLIALTNLCDAFLQGGSPDRALPRCEAAARSAPNDALAQYNLAGAYALLGRREDALAALERDADLGDTDWAYLESDRWFETLRHEPRFRSVVTRMRGG